MRTSALKWLGECGQRGQPLPVAAAVGVSAPFNLGVVAEKIERGFSRIYQWYLLRSLRRDVARKMEAMGDDLGLTRRELRRLNTFFKFDDRISGPWNGFRGAEDYYAKTRSDVLLEARGGPNAHRERRQRPAGAGPPDPAPARCLRQGDAGDHRRRRPSGFCLRPLALVAAVLAGHARAGISFVVLLKTWPTLPSTSCFLIRAFFVCRLSLAVENLALRQQVAVYKHSVKRPKLRPRDRAFWIC